MSIHEIKNAAGEITSLRAVAGKVLGRQIRASFSIKQFGSVAKARSAAERWIERKRRELDVDKHSVIAIPDRRRHEIIEAFELLDPYDMRLVDVVREWVARKEDEQREQWTFRQAADRFLQSRRDKQARPEYLRSIEDTYNLVSRTFGEILLDDITTEAIEEWLRTRGKGGQPISANTWRNYRRDIGMVFRFAMNRGCCRVNSAQNVADPAPEYRPVPIFRAQDIKNILHTSDECIKGVLAIMAFGGLRPFEVLQLPSENIRVDRRFIEVSGRNSKSRTRRLVTIHDSLARWLECYPACCERFANYWSLRRYLEAGAKKAGLSLSQDVLRHSFGSHHLALHRNAALTAHEMGNSEQMVYRHYREVVTQEEATAYFSVAP